MKKLLAFGASTSSSSINRKLAVHAAGQVPDAEVTALDLRDYDLPIYSSDEEEANGAPAAAQQFLDAIRAHDGVVVSLAEHNGSYTAAFKNLYDWTSRIEEKPWSDKPMLLLVYFARRPWRRDRDGSGQSDVSAHGRQARRDV